MKDMSIRERKYIGGRVKVVKLDQVETNIYHFWHWFNILTLDTHSPGRDSRFP